VTDPNRESSDADPAGNRPAEVSTGSGMIPLVPRAASAGVPKRRTNLAARGEPLVWLTGGCIASAVLMIVGLLAFITLRGFTTFWPGPLERLALGDGRVVMGEFSREDVDRRIGEDGEPAVARRVLYKSGNYDITGEDFTWVSDSEVVERSLPEWGLVIERLAWGNAYGTLEAVIDDGQRIEEPSAAWERFKAIHPRMEGLRDELEGIEKAQMGRIAREHEEMRLDRRGAQREFGESSAQLQDLVVRQERREAELNEEFARLQVKVEEIRAEMARYRIEVRAPGGEIIPENRSEPDLPMQIAQVVRAYPANQLGFFGRTGVYLSRWWEFLSGDPREANSEGGVFPAIIGTVLLTFIMIIFVVPLGVIAAIYLREYARQGMLVSIVRISVNNLSGVPSIVYGVFGLGFFCYGLGAWIDHGPSQPFTARGWVTLMVFTLALVAGAITLGVLTRKLNTETVKLEGSRRARLFGIGAFVLWVAAAAAVFMLVWKVPYFEGFYSRKFPDPTVGKSAMIWASLTLAILTLPVVIVATEEALAAVPRSMREGSYACGASKWQTIRRIVLPRALPGIMTGMILAIARGAGEVAPLMLVGAVKLAPELPIALDAPWFGSDRSFMHLGFHIFDLGFQSRNSEAAKSMVYTTTLLLIAIVVTLNVAAILVRSRLRRAFTGGQF
jgi:ABC-type phosphate transport system permease subunit